VCLLPVAISHNIHLAKKAKQHTQIYCHFSKFSTIHAAVFTAALTSCIAETTQRKSVLPENFTAQSKSVIYTTSCRPRCHLRILTLILTLSLTLNLMLTLYLTRTIWLGGEILRECRESLLQADKAIFDCWVLMSALHGSGWNVSLCFTTMHVLTHVVVKQWFGQMTRCCSGRTQTNIVSHRRRLSFIRLRFRSAIWIATKIDSFSSAIWFRSAIPIPKPNSIPIPTPIPNPNSTPNPIFNRNPNQNRKPNTKPTCTKPDTRTKKYLAVIRNYCSNKTTHLQVENKYMTKANLCIHLQMSNHSFFGITWIEFKTNPAKWRRQLIINRKWCRHDLDLTIFPWLVSDRRSEPIINLRLGSR